VVLRYCSWDYVARPFDPLLAGDFSSQASRSHTLALALDPNYSLVEFRSPFETLRCHNVALCGPASTSLDVFLPSLPCTLQSKKTSPRNYPCPSLQEITSISSSNCCAVLSEKFDFLISLRCSFQMPIKVLIILQLSNQQPILDSN